MADRTHQAIGISGNSLQGFSHQFVSLPKTIDIRSDEGSDPFLPSHPNKSDPSFLIKRLTEMHESASVPGTKASQ